MKKPVLFLCLFAVAANVVAQRDTSFNLMKGVEYFENGDYKNAFPIFSYAANHGNAYGQNCLGLLYSNGYGVERNDSLAVELFRKSAEQGNYYGQNNLGWMFENGNGVDQEYGKAVSWYVKSAKQGYSLAQYNLGMFYVKGYGVQQSYG